MIQRECGDCQLCCKLLPVRELQKKANTRCTHQQHGKGCAVYRKPGFPPSCALWNCRWLVNDDTAALRRPDRVHYVVDMLPDFITIDPDEGERYNIECIQVWVDPDYPDAHRDPALRAYLSRRGEEGKVALIRWGSYKAITLFPPSMCADGQWHEQGGTSIKREERALAETIKVVSELRRTPRDLTFK
jgi:hypothetical protein